LSGESTLVSQETNMAHTTSAGYLHLIIGPMFSGKTTELIRLTSIQEAIGRSVRIIKHEIDNRYDAQCAVTHSGTIKKASAISSLLEIAESAEEDVIGIDEGQFFEDLFESVKILLGRGKVVIIASLDGDFKMEPFGSIIQLFQLIPLSDRVEKLRAICAKCRLQEAPFTMKKEVGSGVVEVGGKDKYLATCRGCHERP
jgi:thymidine kinase